ncbi:5'-nucleotidase C-terminal domain-containing protein [Microbacterium aurum]
MLPFSDTLGLITLTGAQFRTMLEQQWQRNPDGTVPSRPYLQLGLSDNVSYTYDATRPEGERITSVTIDGAPLEDEAAYRIGTFSFLASGGDNFRAFTQGTDYVDTGLLDYEAWVDGIADGSPLAPDFAEHAVQVTGVPGDGDRRGCRGVPRERPRPDEPRRTAEHGAAGESERRRPR